jgi:uncharacterized cupin superfamily protein
MAAAPQSLRHVLSKEDIDTLPEAHISHPWNLNSDVFLKRLGLQAGLSRIALTLARVPPKKESFLYRRHERDEAFLFLLPGRGRAEIDDFLAR